MLLQEVRARADQRLDGATIEWGDTEAIPSVVGDKALLQQAFLGLLTAATEQVLEGTVAVTARMAQDNSQRIVIRIGTASSEVFDSPERVEAPGSVEDDLEEMSVDLGLAHRIVTLHGGKLRFVFDPNDGWNSIVILPAEHRQSKL
jgi:hypothetical protein